MRPWKSLKEMASDKGDVEARMIVSAPRTMAHAATTDTPNLGRSLGLSVGWETAVNTVIGLYMLTVEAALGGVGLVDVQDVEAVTKKKTTKA